MKAPRVCSVIIAILLSIALNQAVFAATIFTESIGTVSGTTSFATHTTNDGWDNDDLAFSGTGDLRVTTPSTGYTGASGSANVFLTNNGTASFEIADIDTSLYEPTFTLSFGAYKSTTASDMSQLVLEYSDDGSTYTPIPIPAQPTGGGTANWRLITLSDITLPTVGDLSLRWRNSSSGTGSTQFRIDDISLSGVVVPEPASVALAMLGLVALTGMSRRRVR